MLWVSRARSPCSCLFSSALSCKLQPPWPLQTLSDCPFNPGNVLGSLKAPYLHAAYRLSQGSNWGDCRVHFLCYPPFKYHFPLFPGIQCLVNCCFLYFACILFVPYGMVNLACTPSLWQAEFPLRCFFRFFFFFLAAPHGI